jgi:hypothetical protein
VDLYDRVNLIPFDKLTAFFTDALKAAPDPGRGARDSVELTGGKHP